MILLFLFSHSGFLTDDLVSHEENGEQKKYMGVCRLLGPSQRHRRLDIIVVPYAEFACALLYFTGSAHFNRSMRALAKTKHMSLSEHSLNCAVVRQGGVKLVAGTPLHTPTEKDVFKHLGIPYREPHERDWWQGYIHIIWLCFTWEHFMILTTCNHAVVITILMWECTIELF